MKINTAIQQETTGCGFACVAMLANRPYEEIKTMASKLGIFAEDENLWSDTAYVRQLMEKYQIKASKVETPFSSWGELPNLALLAVKDHIAKGRPSWHLVHFRKKQGQTGCS